tara:strand:- start:301 stop:471 length:171 start_codon:yes stop_codon:yes gene_type:complete
MGKERIMRKEKKERVGKKKINQLSLKAALDLKDKMENENQSGSTKYRHLMKYLATK